MGHTENTAHEAYSFVCMRCGHGWEQEYEIEHLEYADGSPVVAYYCEGRRVPSPLKHPTCAYCDGHQVRIMRSGRVSNVEAATAREAALRVSPPSQRSARSPRSPRRP
jgi:hypothetical protein